MPHVDDGSLDGLAPIRVDHTQMQAQWDTRTALGDVASHLPWVEVEWSRCLLRGEDAGGGSEGISGIAHRVAGDPENLGLLASAPGQGHSGQAESRYLFDRATSFHGEKILSLGGGCPTCLPSTPVSSMAGTVRAAMPSVAFCSLVVI